MKKIILLISLLSTTVFATDWYVDKNASGGSNNGTSWANAWQSFADISWGSVNPGDVVYVSGGTDSTVYYETLILEDIHGTAANHITIRNSYDANHNGRVIIDSEYIRNQGITIGNSEANACDYLYIKGFEVRQCAATGSSWGIGGKYQNNVITVDSCYVYDNRFNGFRFYGVDTSPYTTDALACDSITIKNSYASNLEGDPLADQTDLYAGTANTNTVIDNNVFHLRRPLFSNASHADGIQTISSEGFRITNNFFIDDSGCYSQALILNAWDDTEDGRVDSVIIYNNVFYEGGTWDNPAGTGTGTTFLLRNTRMIANTYQAPIVVAHNTIIAYGPNYIAVNAETYRKIGYFKNNIVAQYGSGNDGEQVLNYKDFFGTGASDTTNLDNYAGNLYYKEWATEDFNTGTGGYWLGCNGDSLSASGETIIGVENLNFSYCADDTAGNPYLQTNFLYGSTPGNHRQSIIDSYTMEDFRNGDRPTFFIPSDSSDALNFGVDIQSDIEGMGLNWTDIVGNARDSTPDVGAYQYSAVADETTNPTKLIMKK